MVPLHARGSTWPLQCLQNSYFMQSVFIVCQPTYQVILNPLCRSRQHLSLVIQISTLFILTTCYTSKLFCFPFVSKVLSLLLQTKNNKIFQLSFYPHKCSDSIMHLFFSLYQFLTTPTFLSSVTFPYLMCIIFSWSTVGKKVHFKS